LERFFNQQFSLGPDADHRGRLIEILNDVVKDFSAGHYVKNPSVLECHQEWLLDALMNLIRQLDHQSRPLASELDFGLKDKARPPLVLKGDERSYLLGGRIDRVDKTDRGYLIVDYKLSSSDALRSKLSPKSLFKGNFQAPIYLRLVARHFAKDDKNAVAFTFASIRDGEVLAPMATSGNEDLLARIFDDDKDNSLFREIDRIFLPITRGEMIAHVGEHCGQCDFGYICRKKEEEHHGS
jgi:ATP-dependent helicase/DNAse subunit B